MADDREQAGQAPEEIRRVRVSDAGIATFGEEELIVERVAPRVGSAVCVESGQRLAFRRVLEVRGDELRLRADCAPFDDWWRGDIVGCVRPRLVDRVAAVAPEAWTRANWLAAVGVAHALAARRRLLPRRRVAVTTRALEAAEWPRVRQFWIEACGRELHISAQSHQQVIGLFDGARLVGANIHLVFGTTSYSAFTLVDRRYRGIGGGLQMILHALSVARTQQLENVYVHINARNLPSIRAYQRAGFQRTGWWSDAADPLASAERQWLVFELDLTAPARGVARSGV